MNEAAKSSEGERHRAVISGENSGSDWLSLAVLVIDVFLVVGLVCCPDAGLTTQLSKRSEAAGLKLAGSTVRDSKMRLDKTSWVLFLEVIFLID